MESVGLKSRFNFAVNKIGQAKLECPYLIFDSLIVRIKENDCMDLHTEMEIKDKKILALNLCKEYPRNHTLFLLFIKQK